MSEAQEIILYRNPAEKAIWDAMSGGEIFPFMVAAAVFIVAFIVTAKALEKFIPWHKRKQWWPQLILWGIPSLAAIVTVKAMIL